MDMKNMLLKYATLAVKKGVNLQKDQVLLVINGYIKRSTKLGI